MEVTELTEVDKRLVYLVIIELWKKFMPEKAYSKDDIKHLKEYTENSDFSSGNYEKYIIAENKGE